MLRLEPKYFLRKKVYLCIYEITFRELLEGEVVMIVAMVAIDKIIEPGVFIGALSITAVFIRTDYYVNNSVRKILMRQNLLGNLSDFCFPLCC